MIIRCEDKAKFRQELMQVLGFDSAVDIETLEDERYQYYLIIEDDNIVGYGYWFVGGGADNYSVFVLIRDQYRRRGYGRQLFRHIEKDLLERRAKTLFSECEYSEATRNFMVAESFSASAADIMICHTVQIPVDPTYIRQARKEDFYDVMHIWTSSYRNMLRSLGHPFTEEDIEEEADDSGIENYLRSLSDRYVLETENGIIAEGEISENHIGGIGVRISDQNKGYGTRLTAFLTQEIFSRGYSEAVLYCEEGNSAKHVYEKVG